MSEVPLCFPTPFQRRSYSAAAAPKPSNSKPRICEALRPARPGRACRAMTLEPLISGRCLLEYIIGTQRSSPEIALPTGTKVESGTSQSKSGTSVNLSNSGNSLHSQVRDIMTGQLRIGEQAPRSKDIRKFLEEHTHFECVDPAMLVRTLHPDFSPFNPAP